MTAIGSPDLDSPAIAREGSPDLGCPDLGHFDCRQQEREKAVLSLADQIDVIKSIKMMGLVRFISARLVSRKLANRAHVGNSGATE